MNIVKGDKVVWDAPQFSGGSFFRGRRTGKPRFTGNKRFSGIVERDSYGQKTGQHTFSIRLDDGTLKRVMGRNLYPNIVEHIPGEAHDENAKNKSDRKELNRMYRGA